MAPVLTDRFARGPTVRAPAPARACAVAATVGTGATMSSIGEGGTGLGEVRARNALQAAGLDPHVPLERASSVTNEVWLTAGHAVRVNRRRDRRLAREAIIAASLPAVIGSPELVAKAKGPGEDWLRSERRPGWPPAHRWPTLTVDQRGRAIGQVTDRKDD